MGWTVREKSQRYFLEVWAESEKAAALVSSLYLQAPHWRTAAAPLGRSVPASVPAWTRWSAAATNTCSCCPEDFLATSRSCEFLQTEENVWCRTWNPFRIKREKILWGFWCVGFYLLWLLEGQPGWDSALSLQVSGREPVHQRSPGISHLQKPAADVRFLCWPTSKHQSECWSSGIPAENPHKSVYI